MRLFSTHHRAIGFGYLLISIVAVAVGTLLSLAMRTHLAWPDWPLPLHGPVLPEEYLALVTMHGTLMLFFVLTVAPLGSWLPSLVASEELTRGPGASAKSDPTAMPGSVFVPIMNFGSVAPSIQPGARAPPSIHR